MVTCFLTRDDVCTLNSGNVSEAKIFVMLSNTERWSIYQIEAVGKLYLLCKFQDIKVLCKSHLDIFNNKNDTSSSSSNECRSCC